MVSMEVIEYIKLSLCITKTVFQSTRTTKTIFKTTMLEYLVTYNSSVTAVYIEVISEIKFQIHPIYLE